MNILKKLLSVFKNTNQSENEKNLLKTICLLESDLQTKADLHDSVLEVVDSQTDLIRSKNLIIKKQLEDIEGYRKKINKLRANLRYYKK